MNESPHRISWLSMDQWQSYVDGHTDSSIFHHRAWLELLNEQYGFQIRIPARSIGQEIRAAIPLLQTRSLRGTKKLISLPFTDYLTLLSIGDQATGELCQQLKQEWLGQFEAVVIRGDRPVPGLEHESHKVRHELTTDLPMSEIESRFSSAVRRNLRKGNRQQLEFHKRYDPEAIEIFYRLHVLTRKKLGVPVQQKNIFSAFTKK